MKLINRTDYPRPQVLECAKAGAYGVDDAHVDLTVEHNRSRKPGFQWPWGFVNYKGNTQPYLAKIYIPNIGMTGPYSIPQYSREIRCEYPGGITVETWMDCMVWATAMVMMMVQFRREGHMPNTIVWYTAEDYAMQILNRYRAQQNVAMIEPVVLPDPPAEVVDTSQVHVSRLNRVVRI